MDSDLENHIFHTNLPIDQISYEQLYKTYYRPLFLFVRKFVDEDLAKDIVQDCFVELWQNRKSIHINTSISAYMFTVVKNRCYNHFKKVSIRSGKNSAVELKLKQAELNYYINSERSILEFDTRDRIQKTYEKLPEKCAEVFKESRLNGLKNKEIADKYDISLKAVEKHISKALKLFKEEFKDIISVLIILLLQNF